ncbi:MAG TPA: creatininase family protein, partial [Rhodospirillaceae bacterium]|nr:creatininase family protein [Rhodospirillaceae bacterium]
MIRLACLLAILCGTAAAAAEPPENLFLANLTSPELRRAIDGGKRTVILPTGGIEQNG